MVSINKFLLIVKRLEHNALVCIPLSPVFSRHTGGVPNFMDEATSYTDPENEAVVQEAISRLTREKTLIVTITDSDQIVVVKDGQIQAKGTHEELLNECNLYHKMWTAHMDAKEVKTA